MKILVLNCGSSTLKFQLIETAEAVIFSGGIGENSPAIREKICQNMEWCGLKLDFSANSQAKMDEFLPGIPG